MRLRIRYCPKCKRYTLKEKCPICGSPTIVKAPPKYSPHSKYAKYRRAMKRKILEERGLL